MIRDPFDIDHFFRKIEEQIERATKGYGAYKTRTRSSYDDYFMEDDEYVYMTVDIGIEPNDLRADIEDNNVLVVIIDTGYERITLPTKVEKVEKITCINGILDIKIKKSNERERKDE